MWVGEWVGHLTAGAPQGVTFFVLFSLSLSLDSCDILSSLSLDYLCLESQLDVSSSFFFLFSFYFGCPHTALGRCSRPLHPTITYHLSITSPDVSFLHAVYGLVDYIFLTLWVGEWVGYLWQAPHEGLLSSASYPVMFE